MKNYLLLILGVVITLLFLLFPSSVFEAGYYEREFSNEMYNENLYLIVAVITVAVAWGMAALFYYVINSVSFSRWYHWLIMLAVASLLAPVITYGHSSSTFDSLGYDFSSQLFSFCIVDFVLTALLFIIASFSLRWWSRNCRHTPIPE
ncbi:MAG: hypothetical protein ACOYJF_08050 [Prevotella sp.]|jgi:hypothetical protein